MKTMLRSLLMASTLLLPMVSSASVFVSVNIAPPALPVYEQPYCPDEGYIWTPGYWAWDDYEGEYYWVPGTWVLPPRAGYLWTPAYWGWENDVYFFHPGYWGPHVGFYGGINYGYGYTGSGYWGGRWEGSVFRYNTAVTHVNVTHVHNTYNTVVINNVTVNHVSYNGGGGTHARPSRDEEVAQHDHHINFTAEQSHHQQEARQDPSQFASSNHGRPPVTATPHAGAFDRGNGRNNDRGSDDNHVRGNDDARGRFDRNQSSSTDRDVSGDDRPDRPVRGGLLGNSQDRPQRAEQQPQQSESGNGILGRTRQPRENQNSQPATAQPSDSSSNSPRYQGHRRQDMGDGADNGMQSPHGGSQVIQPRVQRPDMPSRPDIPPVRQGGGVLSPSQQPQGRPQMQEQPRGPQGAQGGGQHPQQQRPPHEGGQRRDDR